MGAFIFLVLLVMVVVGAVYMWQLSQKCAQDEANSIIIQHLDELRRQQDRGYTTDAYGGVVDAGWYNECKYFYNRYLSESTRKHIPLNEFNRLIGEAIINNPPKEEVRSLETRVVTSKSGKDYEHVVKEELERLGWEVRHTGKSGDQGADLVASMGKFKVVVQCKFYATSIGNKAVQEAAAAKAYYSAQGAILVSSAPFTVAAKQLASANDVLLFHHSELEDFDMVYSVNADIFNERF